VVSVGAVALAAVLVGSFPALVGASWPAIAAELTGVPVIVVAGLVALWFLGLLVHVPVLRSALPGLSARQALVLNLSGSAVSNVVPIGGPVGMGLGYAMARSWGFRSDRFASYVVATNLWNALGKFLMGLTVLVLATAFGLGLPTGLGPIVVSAAAFVLVAAGIVVTTFRTEPATTAVGGRLDHLVRRVRPSSAPDACASWLRSSRRELGVAVRSGWRRMSLGVLAYLALQATLLFCCLAAVGVRTSLAVVAVAFAIERLISLAPLTPGSAGLAELGTVAALHSFGLAPVGAAAGVLLYRLLMYGMEIPIGGALALGWWHRLRRRAALVPPGVLAAAALPGAPHPGPAGAAA
jgi:uncharacterized protein (TIRG00374 family)